MRTSTAKELRQKTADWRGSRQVADRVACPCRSLGPVCLQHVQGCLEPSCALLPQDGSFSRGPLQLSLEETETTSTSSDAETGGCQRMLPEKR